MKKQFLLVIALMISVCAFSQKNKHEKNDSSLIKDSHLNLTAIPKKLFIQIDSADAVNFLTIFQIGLQSLMTTQIPANQVTGLQQYGSVFLQKQIDIYNSWQPKQVTDTTKHK